MLVVSKLGFFFDLSSCDRESFKDLSNVGARLHRDDTELILFVDPHKECLVVVVEDTTGFGPFALEATALQVFVTSLEEEMILDQLVFLSLSHASKGVVLAFKFSGEVVQDTNNFRFNFLPLCSSACSSKRIVSEVTSDADSGRVDHLIFVGWEVWTFQISIVHV